MNKHAPPDAHELPSQTSLLRAVITPKAPSAAPDDSMRELPPPPQAPPNGKLALDRYEGHRDEFYRRFALALSKRKGFLAWVIAPFTVRFRAVLAKLEVIEHALLHLMGDRQAAIENQTLAATLQAVRQQACVDEEKLRRQLGLHISRALVLRGTLEQLRSHKVIDMMAGLIAGKAAAPETASTLAYLEKLVEDVCAEDDAILGGAPPKQKVFTIVPAPKRKQPAPRKQSPPKKPALKPQAPTTPTLLANEPVIAASHA